MGFKDTCVRLWCDTCWPLGSQHGGWAILIHLFANVRALVGLESRIEHATTSQYVTRQTLPNELCSGDLIISLIIGITTNRNVRVTYITSIYYTCACCTLQTEYFTNTQNFIGSEVQIHPPTAQYILSLSHRKLFVHVSPKEWTEGQGLHVHLWESILSIYSLALPMKQNRQPTIFYLAMSAWAIWI